MLFFSFLFSFSMVFKKCKWILHPSLTRFCPPVIAKDIIVPSKKVPTIFKAHLLRSNPYINPFSLLPSETPTISLSHFLKLDSN